MDAAGDDDQLLSVIQIARRFGTGINTIVTLVQAGTLPSLDRGRLIAQKRFDVPLIRPSWVESLQFDVPGKHRRISSASKEVRNAIQAAIDFHYAVSTNDVEAMFRLSSAATVASADGPQELAARWRAGLGEMMNPSTGIATETFSLAPLDALVLWVVYDAPGVPTVSATQKPMVIATFLPLVRESDSWKVDLGLWSDQESLKLLLSQPLPP